MVFWNDLAFQVNPVGRVNRQADETAVKFQDEWVEAVDLELAKSPAAGLQMAVEFDEAAGKLAVHVHTTWFEDWKVKPVSRCWCRRTTSLAAVVLRQRP